MKPEVILHADMLDILFENRNKSYGAYALRREYPRELLKGLIVTGGIVCLAFVLQAMKFSDSSGKENHITGIPKETVLKKVEIMPDPIEKKIKVPVKTVQWTKPLIVDEPEVKPIAEIKDLINADVGKETIDGPPATDDVVQPPSEGTEAVTEKVGPEKTENEILIAPEVRPEFPGGLNGWIRFLKKNLRPIESDEAYKITVIIKFVVNEDGTLSHLEIAKSGGNEFDSEVMRVMKKSPHWIAGSNYGRKVKVYHSQAVTFVSEADE